MCDGVWAPTCSRPTAIPLLYWDPGPPAPPTLGVGQKRRALTLGLTWRVRGEKL